MSRSHPHRRSTVVLSIASLTLLAAFAGCASKSASASPSSGPAAPVQTQSEHFPVVHADWAKVGYRLDWVGFPFPASGSNPKVVSMAAFGDVVVAQERGSTVSALEAGTGQVRWSSRLTGSLTKWTGMHREMGEAGRLLITSEAEVFMLGMGTGVLVGREQFERVVNTPPLPAGGGALIVAGTSSGVVQAHLVGRNVAAWSFGTGGSIVGDLCRVGDFIGAVSQSGEVVFLTDRGDLVGRGRVLGPIDNDPVTDGLSLFIAGRDQSVWAFTPSGQALWRYRTNNPLSQQPTVHGAVLYQDLGALGLTAFDTASGVVKWHSKGVHGTVIGARQGNLLVWDGIGLSTVDPTRGDQIERVALPGIVRLVPDGFDDGSIYAVSDKGVFAKFVPR